LTSFFFIINKLPSFGSFLLRKCLNRNIPTRTINKSKTHPPMTPPIIAPTFELRAILSKRKKEIKIRIQNKKQLNFKL
jgi:hypothetical protein